MGSTGNMGTDQSVFCVKNTGINGFQGISSAVIIAITGAVCKFVMNDFILMLGINYFYLVIFSDLVNLGNTFL